MVSAHLGRWKRWEIITGAGAATILVAFAAVLLCWPNNFYADDSYFYFQVAWNIARGMGSTFNGIVPTNGYHPLWMLVCVGVFKLVSSKLAATRAIAIVITLLDLVAISLVVKLLRSRGATLWVLAVVIYGAFAFTSQLGTEGALSGLFLAALLVSAHYLLRTASISAAALYMLCAALAVLSRLDSIFIVTFVTLSIFLFSPVGERSVIRRAMLLCSVIPAALWAAYIASNVIWFGTVQPISGLLKSHGADKHQIFSNLPHVGMFGLALVIPCVVFLWFVQRDDSFFRTVELPFALGVLVHAMYIIFVMSSETKWTWYYTSWILLGSYLVARVGSILLRRSSETTYLAASMLALLVFAAAWFGVSYRAYGYFHAGSVGEGYQENLSERAHLHRVLAFDKPGRMAYFTDVSVVALDGLMGDLQFQKDLQTKGILAFDSQHEIDGFVGPPQPMNEPQKHLFCDAPYLGSVQLQCRPIGNGKWMPDGVTVFSRLSGTPGGTIPLRDEDIVWNDSTEVAVWRLHPQMR